MRIVEKVLYGFGGLLALMLLFIAICHYNPELAVKIGADLKANAGEANPEYTMDFQTVNTTVTHGVLPAAEKTLTNNTIPVGTVRTADDEDTDADAESKLKIPSKVAGLNGYIPVKATGKEITQNKADEIAKELGKGETGSNLTFDTEMYPYYGIINETQKAVYRDRKSVV